MFDFMSIFSVPFFRHTRKQRVNRLLTCAKTVIA
jgi:hypothetical protein